MLAYAVTIFLVAFLLFQVQPLIAKFVLPWFGGGPGVWTTCLMFFQSLLVAGYAYAHWTTQKLKPKTQTWLHLLLLAAALASLPIVPSDRWKPGTGAQPIWAIFALLGATVGLPYFVLSSTGPLLQRWFHQQFPAASPYRLYALSNFGSLLALVSFPFLFEPHLTRKLMAQSWAVGLVVYGIVCAICAWRQKDAEAQRRVPATESSEDPHTSHSTLLAKVLWVLLPTATSILLLATTNKLCQDVAVVPFLWVAPLSIYLATFILCFESEGWYRRVPYTLFLCIALAGVYWGLTRGGDWPLPRQLLIYGTALFMGCMVLHGELYRLRPAPSELTQYYLWISIGGALGGIMVAVGAPLFFTGFFELHWAIVLAPVLVLVIWVCEGSKLLPSGLAPSSS